jgi:polyisoprenoid-binding protein YceI
MRRQVRGLTTAVVCLLVAGAWRPVAPADPLTLAPESKLWFDGKSTVRDWSCKATALEATVDADGSGAVAAVLGGTKAVRTVAFSVPVDQLDCDNKTMNGHMWKALNASTHRTIAFTLSGYEFGEGTPLRGTLQGTLTLNGVEKPIVLPVEFEAGEGGTLRVKGLYALRMTDWGVKPPSLMLGTMKVREMVNVGFDLLLK